MAIQHHVTARRRATWYDKPPATEEECQDVEQFLAWRFPYETALHNLRKELALVRGEALELARRGFRGRELNDLRSDAVRLEGEIEQLIRENNPQLRRA
jgi:hypothetical protein